MEYKNFIWDFDGTLYDTYPHTLAALMENFRRHGREIDPAEAYRIMKITLWDAFRFYNVDDAFIAAFYEIENDLSFPPVAGAFPGIPALLERLRDAGGRHYLYTHRDRVSLQYLERDGLLTLFSGWVTREHGFPHKPAPDALRFLMQTNGLNANETLMVGDRPIDIGAGHAAGIAGCLFDPERLHPDCPCEIRCENVEALAAALGSPAYF